MAFDHVRLDNGFIIYGASGGGEFSTGIQTIRSGHEARNDNWSEGRGRWDYGERKVLETELRTVINFHRARHGKARGFLWKDWGDFEDWGQGIVNADGLGNGTATGQLYKKYPSGPSQDLRKIRKPVAGTITVFKNGTALAGVTVSSTTGVVTFGSPFPTASDVLTATFQFDCAVRFDSDHLKYRFDAARVVAPGSLGEKAFYIFTLPIVELRTDE